LILDYIVTKHRIF